MRTTKNTHVYIVQTHVTVRCCFIIFWVTQLTVLFEISNIVYAFPLQLHHQQNQQNQVCYIDTCTDIVIRHFKQHACSQVNTHVYIVQTHVTVRCCFIIFWVTQLTVLFEISNIVYAFPLQLHHQQNQQNQVCYIDTCTDIVIRHFKQHACSQVHSTHTVHTRTRTHTHTRTHTQAKKLNSVLYYLSGFVIKVYCYMMKPYINGIYA